MLDWEPRSGSLNDKKCLLPDEMAEAAAAPHAPTELRPQHIGTYSMPEGMVPSGPAPQL